MNTELKQKWVDALRSGDYIQDNGQLKSKTGYCCLGVLAEIAGLTIKNGGICLLEDDREDYNKRNDIYPTLGEIIVVEGACNTLYQMNDNRGKSFKEIADYIETNL